MAYYDPLIAKWPTVAGETDAEKITALNAEVVPKAVWVDLDVGTLAGYMERTGVMEQLQAAPANLTAAKAVRIVTGQTQIRTLRMSEAENRLPILGMLDQLVADTVITQTQRDEMAALANPDMPWWQANGYDEPINVGDVEIAGLASNGAQWRYTVESVVPDPKNANIVATVSFTDANDPGFTPITRQVWAFDLSNDVIAKWARAVTRTLAVRRANAAAITTGAAVAVE